MNNLRNQNNIFDMIIQLDKAKANQIKPKVLFLKYKLATSTQEKSQLEATKKYGIYFVSRL